MARKKTIQNTDDQNVFNDLKSEHQTITVPLYIDMEEQFGHLGDQEQNKNEIQQEFVIEMAESKNFDIVTKKYLVFLNQEYLEQIEEGSDKLEFYLDQNKSVLDSWIADLKKECTNPNDLIFFHEGPQKRSFMSFQAFYSQNGLAPKQQILFSWMDYYKSKNPNLSEEEIALNINGNLPYSFSLPNDIQ